jgi:hypothetical protein
MMINAGGLIGPVVAAQVRNRTEFHYVFWVSAAACALMLVQAVIAYREPVPIEERRSGKTFGQIGREIVMVLGNWRFVLLLVIFSGFWGMINTLFGFMPLYVDTFSDLRAAEAAIDTVVPVTKVAGHWLNAEVLISLDALLIVLFQAMISYLTRRWPTLRAMLVGTTIATVSWVLPAMSPTTAIVALGIAVWAFGEMICSARFFEYCGTVAPKDQVALYLGYSFFAIFIGNTYSGPWAGWLYQRFILEPFEVGAAIQPWMYFGGVMLMGAFSVIGLALYGLFVKPDRGDPAPAEAP